MRYDTTLKELFRTPPLQLLSLIAGARPTEFLTVDYPAVRMRRPDLVFRLPNGEIRHLELQSGNDRAMDWRMLEYYPLLYREFKTEPVQQLLYLGPRRMTMNVEIRHKNLQYCYEALDIRDLDAEPLLASDSPADNLMAILCRNGTGRDVVRRIIRKLRNLPKRECIDRLTQLLLLSGLRNLESLVFEESKPMSLQINLMENVVLRGMVLDYQKKSLEKGIAIGQAKMLRLQLEQRFGRLPKWAVGLIDKADGKKLENWCMKLVDAKHLEDVLPKPKPARLLAAQHKGKNGSKK